MSSCMELEQELVRVLKSTDHGPRPLPRLSVVILDVECQCHLHADYQKLPLETSRGYIVSHYEPCVLLCGESSYWDR